MRLRPAFVVTVSAASVVAGCTAACPSEIEEGDSCLLPSTVTCKKREGCGSNGFTCEKGKWKQHFTYCNPAAPGR
jgi:hypothetical protein